MDGVWLAGKAGKLANGILLICMRTVQIRSPFLLTSLPCKQQHAGLQYIEPEQARASQMNVIAGCDRVQPVRPFKWQALYSVFLPMNLCRFSVGQLLSSVVKCP